MTAAERSGWGEAMLEGVRVLDLTEPPGWLCGRILADLGADVVLVEPPGGHPGRARRFAFAAFSAGKRSVLADVATPEGLKRVAALAAEADVVVESGQPALAGLRAGPHARRVWCAITPFGLTGPKSGWRASDLGVLAQSGTMFLTGDADRAPLRCTFPTSWFHGSADAAAAILAALHHRERTGRGQLVDVSLQEAHVMATMGRVGAFSLTGERGRRAGALMRVGRTVQREIWPCADGYVSFGLRGGPARIPGLKRLVAWMGEEGFATADLLERDWDSYPHAALTQEEVDAISEPIARFFARKTMTELYRAALDRGLMLAPANTMREVLASPQAEARGLFVELADPELGRIRLPRRFAVAEGIPGVRRPAPRPGDAGDAPWPPRDADPPSPSPPAAPAGAFAGLRVVELGSGAAGPLATRYLADHGATVVRVESRRRPDFLRLYALTPTQRSLEASPMFAAFNCNKLGVTLDLRSPEGRELALRLVRWADVVVENFAPGTLERLGLGADVLLAANPALVLLSTCLHGQTGPERDYPGFGGQGSALAGFNHLTGWPDREPLGPYGTITDSLAPRYAAAAVAGALLRRQRTGRGARIDLSQVECAVHALGEAVVQYAVTGVPPGRDGNRAPDAAPHGAFRCAGEDRWVAIACHSDEDWRRLVAAMGHPAWADDRFRTLAGRKAHEDELEEGLEAWTAGQDRDALAGRLQALGLEACPVQDLGDCHDDPQLAHRGHLHPLDHPVLGRHEVEALGFRLERSPPAFVRAAPTLGQDNDRVFRDLLGISAAELARLGAAGALG